MKELSQVTACVVDHGLFIPLAECLAGWCKRVLYWSPYEEGFSTLRRGCFGDGYENIERCQDIWTAKSDIDLFVFPDIQHAGLQQELAAQGFPVWGSRLGDEIELDRELFLDLLDDAGLEQPRFTLIQGLPKLRDFLSREKDKYIKISRWRGDFETAHWRSWELDAGLLDVWGVQFGPVGELVRFLVFDAIDTDLEIGADTYCVDGRFPSLMLNGIEWKDKSYFAAVTDTDQMPNQIRQTLESFGPLFRDYEYRNQLSLEIRVKGDHFWFIDPTCRGGLPSTASQIAAWKNLPEIIWAGAHGELVDPKPRCQFTMECVLTTKWEKDSWAVAEFPPELEEWVKPYRSCKIGNRHVFPPNEFGDELGWLVSIGNTPGQALEAMKTHVGLLPDGVCANIESLVHVIQEIESAQEQGVPFTRMPLPEPAEVVED